MLYFRLQEISSDGCYTTTVLGGAGAGCVPQHCVEGNTWFKADLMVEQHLLAGSSFIVMTDYLIAGGNRYLQSGFLYLCAPLLLGYLHISHGNSDDTTLPSFG